MSSRCRFVATSCKNRLMEEARHIDLVAGRNAWSAMKARLAGRWRTYAAIAYVGGGAAERLDLGPDDLIVVNASPTHDSKDSVAQGIVDPNELQEWFDSGAEVAAHPWLHAKMIATERVDGTYATVIGSANLSQRSESDLEESVVVCDDPELFEAARISILNWRMSTEAGVIDQEWLDLAKKRYHVRHRTKRRTAAREKIDASRVMVSDWVPDRDPLPTTVERAIVGLSGSVSDRDIEPWRIVDEPELDLRRGDVVVLVNASGDDADLDTLHGGRRVHPPAVVYDVVPEGDSHYVLLATSADQRRKVNLSTLRGNFPVIDWGAISTDVSQNRKLLKLFEK